jgi:hypothetical protein
LKQVKTMTKKIDESWYIPRTARAHDPMHQ